MKKILVGYLKETGENIYKYTVGLTVFYQTENSGMSTVNGLLRRADIVFYK